MVSYDDNGFVYLTDFNEGYRQKPEHIPEYDKDDRIFFCEDRDAEIFPANGKDLFNYLRAARSTPTLTKAAEMNV